MQVPYCNSSKIQKENNIQSISKGLARHHKNTLQIQRSRNNRRAYDARPCTSTAQHTTKNEYSEFYGIPERKKCFDDVRQTRKLKV